MIIFTIYSIKTLLYQRKKTFCRIPLGALYHSRCFIHEDFFCIVFIDEKDLEKCDPPFLNRFEKHLIDLQTFISPQHRPIIQQLHHWFDTFLHRNDLCRKHFPLI